MATFQGSGFAIDIPTGCTDASVYTFTLPNVDGFSPYIIIRFEAVKEPLDLSAYVNRQLEALASNTEEFKLLSQNAGKRGNWGCVVSDCQWGPPITRMQQKYVHFLVPGKPSKVYTLSTTDLAKNHALSSPVFDRMLRSFLPNNTQVI